MVKVPVDKNNWKDTVPIVVMHMRDMEMMMPGSKQLRQTKSRFADMAAGGTGQLMEYAPIGWVSKPGGTFLPTYRGWFWPDAPDEFFQEVCDLLQWPR